MRFRSDQVSKPAKNDKSGNPIKVSRASEAVRASEHLAYISRNGKIEVENDRGETFSGRHQVGVIYREWMEKHDEDRREGSENQNLRQILKAVSTAIRCPITAESRSACPA